jgi:hypothetical protein
VQIQIWYIKLLYAKDTKHYNLGYFQKLGNESVLVFDLAEILGDERSSIEIGTNVEIHQKILHLFSQRIYLVI